MLHQNMQGHKDALLPLKGPLTETTIGHITIIHHLNLELMRLPSKRARHVFMRLGALGSESFSGALVSTFGVAGMSLMLRHIEKNKGVLYIHWT